VGSAPAPAEVKTCPTVPAGTVVAPPAESHVISSPSVPSAKSDTATLKAAVTTAVPSAFVYDVHLYVPAPYSTNSASSPAAVVIFAPPGRIRFL
jgi:hypothetical protein